MELRGLRRVFAYRLADSRVVVLQLSHHLIRRLPRRTRWQSSGGDAGTIQLAATLTAKKVFMDQPPASARPPHPAGYPISNESDGAAAVHLTPEELVDVVYPELRRVAAAQMARENPAATLQATALVHEAWLRLNRSGDLRFKDKAHFFATAAETMRRVLVDRARRRQAVRHGGGQEALEFDSVEIASPANDERVLQVHEALDGLTAEDPIKAQVVKLRFFVGMDEHETAQALGISERTVERHWAYAKAWLYSAIRRG